MSKTQTKTQASSVEECCAGLRDWAERLVQHKKSKTTEAELKAFSQELAYKVCVLRQETRQAYLDEDQAFKRIESVKVEDERRRLALENLLYEKAYLIQEINRCRSYDLTETNKVSLISYEEFKATGPPNLTQDTEAHSIQLNRLSHELLERRNLVNQLKKLREENVKVQAMTSKQQQSLRQIPKHLTELENASKGLQEAFDLRLTERAQRHAKCRDLPTPLYILYAQLEAFSDAFGGVAVSVEDSKEPQKKKAAPKKSKKRKHVDEDEEEDSENEAEENDPYAVHPSFVRALLTHEGVSVNLSFTLLKAQNVVLVSAEDHEALLANLFQNDRGELLPKTGASFPATIKARPYKWAQWLAGLDVLDPVDSQAATPSTKQIVEKVTARIGAQEALSAQLKSLQRNPHPVPVHPNAKNLFPQGAVTKLVNWEELNRSSALYKRHCQAPSRRKRAVPVFPLDPRKAETGADTVDNFGRRCFHGVFETSGKQGCPKEVEIVVQVFMEYPKVAPQFTILEGSNGKDSGLRVVQNEVNAFAQELQKGDPMSLLSHQLRRLQMCLDVVNGDVDKSKQSFGRAKRGRDRRLAFVYDSETLRFKHR